MTLAYLSFLAAAPLPPAGDSIRVETTTLLPGGDLIAVTVAARGETFDVSDGGAGRMAMLALGVQDLTRADMRRGAEVAGELGLVFDGQGFVAPDLSAAQVAAGVAYVADACRTWTAAAIEGRAKRAARNLAGEVAGRLREILPDFPIDENRELLGASTKRHNFDVVVALRGDRFAAFDLVAPAAASIAATHLKFFDLFQAHQDWPREAVVEDLSAWAADDLAVMQQVSSHVRGLTGSWADLTQLGG